MKLIKLLNIYGSDFSLIANCMNQSRDQIKRRFKYLEKRGLNNIFDSKIVEMIENWMNLYLTNILWNSLWFFNYHLFNMIKYVHNNLRANIFDQSAVKKSNSLFWSPYSFFYCFQLFFCCYFNLFLNMLIFYLYYWFIFST